MPLFPDGKKKITMELLLPGITALWDPSADRSEWLSSWIRVFWDPNLWFQGPVILLMLCLVQTLRQNRMLRPPSHCWRDGHLLLGQENLDLMHAIPASVHLHWTQGVGKHIFQVFMEEFHGRISLGISGAEMDPFSQGRHKSTAVFWTSWQQGSIGSQAQSWRREILPRQGESWLH